MAQPMIPPYGPRFGGVPPTPMGMPNPGQPSPGQPNPGMGLGQVFQRLRQGAPTGMDAMNLPMPPGAEEAIPGVNVPHPQQVPIGRNQPMQITPDPMTDSRSSADQFMDLDSQFNENFGMGSGPLGQPMQEFPGRDMAPEEMDELMQQLQQDMGRDIVGNAGPSDRVFKTASGLGKLKPMGAALGMQQLG